MPSILDVLEMVRDEMRGLSFELADLADDFNRMSGHLDSYIQQLR